MNKKYNINTSQKKMVYFKDDCIDFYFQKRKSWNQIVKTNSKKKLITIIKDLFYSKKRDIYFFDEMTKFSEMFFLIDQSPFQGPVLDLCCGYAYWLSKTIKTIHAGVDLFPEKGLYARNINGFFNNEFNKKTYKSVIQADVTKKMPFPDNYFGTVISVCALEHIDRKFINRIFQEIKRILIPGGRFIFTVQTRFGYDIIKKIFSREFVNYSKKLGVENRNLIYPQNWMSIIKNHNFNIKLKKGYIDGKNLLPWAFSLYPDLYDNWINKVGFSDIIRNNKPLTELFFNKIIYKICETGNFESSSLLAFDCQKKC